MSTSKDEKIYDPNQVKDYAKTGWGGAADLSKYGVDYSPEQRDAIAKIFQDSATAAYGKAQTDYSNMMAAEQQSLSDTIRRSQAQAVATGASRGMQAANELSSMLGLQQAAAEQASAMQGSYAQALADAQNKAYEVQNAANQIGMQGYAADSASEAQKYAANIDAYTNDPYRIINEVFALKNSDNPQYQATGDALLQAFFQSMGMDPDSAKQGIANVNTGYMSDENGSLTNAKTPNSWASTSVKGYNHVAGANFRLFINGTKYKAEQGFKASSDVSDAAEAAGVIPGQAFVVPSGKNEGAYYVQGNGKIVKIGGRGLSLESGDYTKLYQALYNAGNIVNVK